MKTLMGIVVLAIVLAASASALHLEIADGTVARIFPQDQIQRAALTQCEQENASFDRLDSAAREACVRHTLALPIPHGGPLTNTAPAPNQVDLREAAGRAATPGNDVLTIQQSHP